MVYYDYPPWATIDGVDYDVHVERDADGEVEWYGLWNGKGYQFTRDWSGPLTVDDIKQDVDQYGLDD